MAPLTTVPQGHLAQVAGMLGSDETVRRLEHLGLTKGTLLQVLSGTDPLFIAVGGVRLGVSRVAAGRILVRGLSDLS